jgi:hypothetical protein
MTKTTAKEKLYALLHPEEDPAGYQNFIADYLAGGHDNESRDAAQAARIALAQAAANAEAAD